MILPQGMFHDSTWRKVSSWTINALNELKLKQYSGQKSALHIACNVEPSLLEVFKSMSA